MWNKSLKDTFKRFYWSFKGFFYPYIVLFPWSQKDTDSKYKKKFAIENVTWIEAEKSFKGIKLL